MKRRSVLVLVPVLGLVLVGLLPVACSKPGESPDDQGTMVPDGGVPDGTPDPGSGKSVMSLVAGGLGGSGNIDGTGATARFESPAYVALDGAGNLYVTDYQNHTIRKVVLSSGVTTTLAGSIQRGWADGTGTAAQFNTPSGLAADGAGNLYISDRLNYTIRKVVLSTGVVSTVAGTATMSGSADGTGSAARFNSPSALALDGTGNLYIADTANQTIRQLVLSTGVVSTVAGGVGMSGSADGAGTAARFMGPGGLALDGAGNLYVSDTANHTIRQLVLSTGMVSTVAGTAGMTGNTNAVGAAARFWNPSQLTWEGGSLYIADNANHSIRKLEVATSTVSTLVGYAFGSGSADGVGGAARFENPLGVVADGAGNLYVGDTENFTIRKVVIATRTATTFAGAALQRNSTDSTGAAARFFGPAGVAVDRAGNVYIGDTANRTIRKVVPQTGATTTVAGTANMPGNADGTGAAARFQVPYGLTIDSADNLYIADPGNNTIRKTVLSTGVVSTLAGTAGMTGSADGTGAAARFGAPDGLAVDGAGNLYISDEGNATIRKLVIANGVVTTVAGLAGSTGSTDGIGSAARFFQPRGVAVDGAVLYVADGTNCTIRKVELATGLTTTLAGVAGMCSTLDGIGSAARMYYPNGMALDGKGSLYFTELGGHTLRRIWLPTGSVTTVAGTPGKYGVQTGPLPGSLNGPSGVAVSPGGAIYLAAYREHSILEVR